MKQFLKTGVMVFFIFSISAGLSQSHPKKPKGFKKLLPRGRIAAIDNPTYVPGDQAVIALESWVLGVIIDGKALAFSLNLLNSHEVVNGKVNDTHFAAVW